jgi:Na+/H+ antiporter NhaD/arsenite permease-like protein
MLTFIVVVFALTYLGMALGRVPGLKLDRSGIALVAAVVLIAVDAVPMGRVAEAIHFPTVLLLFALMIVSARYAAAGFYDACAAWIARRNAGPSTLLALTIALGGGMSAVLVNDVVVFVMTPLLCAGLAARGRDVRPYLAGLAGAANAGSAATLIGNPQNIVIGQVGHLDFLKFLAVCGPPALVALVIVFAVVRVVWHRELTRETTPAAPVPAVDYDRGQTIKAGLATAVLLALFATPLDRDMSALLVAAVLLMSRRFASRDMLTAVDWPLLILFVGLFIVNDAFALTGLGSDGLAWLAANDLLPDRLSLMAPLMVVLSNTIGNVPAVLALLAIWHNLPEGALYALALLSTLAGNFFLVGSIANLIVAERAAQAGQRFGFIAHARAGVPMTILSLAAACGWLWFTGWLGW